MKTSRRVEENHIVCVLFGIINASFCNFHRIALTHLKDRDIQLSADDLQLFDSGRSVHVARDEKRTLLLLFFE